MMLLLRFKQSQTTDNAIQSFEDMLEIINVRVVSSSTDYSKGITDLILKYNAADISFLIIEMAEDCFNDNFIGHTMSMTQM